MLFQHLLTPLVLASFFSCHLWLIIVVIIKLELWWSVQEPHSLKEEAAPQFNSRGSPIIAKSPV